MGQSSRGLSVVGGIIAIALQGCAGLDAAAVAETHRLDDAPYYVELSQPAPPPGSCAVVLPVALDPGLRQQFGYEARTAEFEPMLAALNARVASMAAAGCMRVTRGPAGAGAPRVYVGTSDSDYAPAEGDMQRLPQDRFAPMILHLERPAESWRTAAGAEIVRNAVPYAIAIQLGVSQYTKGYSGAFRKEVVLGTGYRQPIKFLTAEDKPVEVLHLTGVLMDASGRPVRAGAEGIVLRDTPFIAQTVDAERVFDTVELQRVLSSERRNELPGAPLKLDVALDNLVAQLTRGTVTVPAR
ncbi:MAG: hypothetical protein RL261_2011 [Pseudomonadota bacterium]